MPFPLSLFLPLSLLLLICVREGTADYLEERKVIYLDKSNFPSGPNNYLFRGNEPKMLENGADVFAYDLLTSYMANASALAGVQLPKEYFLIDIKFVYDIYDPFETADIKLETDFFASNPKVGRFNVTVILGDLEDPSLLPIDKVDAMAKTLPEWQHDDLPAYIPYLHQMLNTPQNVSTVIYIHCECGCDRTGEIGASYAIKYLNMTYSQALLWDEKIAGRLILPNHQWAIDWYCFYLSVVEGMHLNC